MLLELFFDLLFVFAFFQVSRQLVADLTPAWRGSLVIAGETLLLLLAFLIIWFVTVWITNLYDTSRPIIQFVVMWATFGGMVMALGLPQAVTDRGLEFAVGYVSIHLGRGAILVPALRGHPAQRRGAGVLLWFAVSAAPWIGAAVFLHNGQRVIVWAVAIAIDITGIILLFPAPWTRSSRSQWPVLAGYLSERCRQFFIIALGELILVAGITYDRKYRGVFQLHSAAFIDSFCTTALVWRIYAYRSGEWLPEALAKATELGRRVQKALIVHVVMVIGIVVTASGYELVIDHPSGHTPPEWVVVIVGGPALFIIGRAGLEATVFSRVSRSRVIGLLVLVALAPAMLFAPPIAAATADTVILAAIAIADTRSFHRDPSRGDLPSPQLGPTP